MSGETVVAVPPLPAARAAPGWRRAVWLALVLAVLCYLPVVLDSRALFGLRLSNTQLLNISLTQVNLMLITLLGALSLNYLTGVAGLVSIGHGAFYALGALAGAAVGTQAGLPFPVVLLASALLGAVAGVVAGLPSLRVRGLYFVLSTFALHYIVVFGLSEYQFRAFDVSGIPFDDAALGPWTLDTPVRWYFFLLVLCVLVYWGLSNTMRAREGRALMATRDHELAAGAAGIDVRVLRLKAFALSSAIAAVAGTLYAYYMTNVNAEFFTIEFAIQFVAIIIIGGMGSLMGSVVGSAVWLLLPAVISGLAANAGSGDTAVGAFLTDNKPQLVNFLFGGLVILLLIFAPEGLAGIGRSVRARLAGGALTGGDMLAVEGLSVSYGRKGLALDGVGLVVPPGGIVALLGANGAGKTTLIRAVTGLLAAHNGRIDAGRVRFGGADATGAAAHRLVRMGMGQVPEGRLVFKQLTVEENLRVGAAAVARREVAERLDGIYALFPRLGERRRQAAGMLSGGEQQMLALGRALIGRPRLLLVDELSLGLAPLIVEAIYERLMSVGQTLGTAMLIVEQNAHLALDYAHTAYVLERGRIVVSGPAATVAASSAIAESYLGLEAAHG